MVVVSKNVTFCKSFFSKGTGLMFRSWQEDFAYVFTFKKKRKFSITMFFVFFPIDIVFIHKGIIVEKATLQPFTNYFAKEWADTFVELPLGKASDIQLGSQIFIDLQKVEIAHKQGKKANIYK